MPERYSPEDGYWFARRSDLEARRDSELRYRIARNAYKRRRLYDFADPPRNIWDGIAKKMHEYGSKSDTVLDVGTGSGYFLERLLRLGHQGRMLGIDANPMQFQGRLEKLRSKDPQGLIRFQEGDALNIHFGPNSFDAAVSNFGWYYFLDQLEAAKQLKNVVRPGGLIVVSSRDEENLAGLLSFVHMAAAEVGAIQHETIYSRCDISTTREIVESEFEVIDTIIQDSPLKIPIDLHHYGDRRGWKIYREAFNSLADSLIDSETMVPISRRKIRQVKSYADKTLWALFKLEANYRLRTEGKAYKGDWVRQGSIVAINSKK